MTAKTKLIDAVRKAFPEQTKSMEADDLSIIIGNARRTNTAIEKAKEYFEAEAPAATQTEKVAAEEQPAKQPAKQLFIPVQNPDGYPAGWYLEFDEGKWAGPFDHKDQAERFTGRFRTVDAQGRKSHAPRTPQEAPTVSTKLASKRVELTNLDDANYDEMNEKLKALPKQARGILQWLSEKAPKGTTLSDMLASLQADAEGERKYLNTSQTALRIFTFYRKRLVDDGFLIVED